MQKKKPSFQAIPNYSVSGLADRNTTSGTPGARKMVRRNKAINCNLGRDTAALFIEHSSEI
jgi:hypothetical protein